MRAAAPDREREAERLVADAVGRLIEFWGFRGVMGRIWAVLYLSEEPLPAAALCERLGISTGAASMALGELQQWGVVERRKLPGQRKDYFAAEVDVWKMVKRVYRERELAEIEKALEAFSRAASLFEVNAQVGDAGERRAARLARERTARLVELTRVGQSLLQALVSRGRIDVRPLVSWTRRVR